MQLELAGEAILSNLNVRREHHGEDYKLGLDLKFDMAMDWDVLVHFSPVLKSMLFDDEKRLRFPALEPIKVKLVYDKHVLQLGDERSYDNVKVSKFEIAPGIDGAVDLTLTAALSAVDPQTLAFLGAVLLEQVVKIDIKPMQSDMFQEETETE